MQCCASIRRKYKRERERERERRRQTHASIRRQIQRNSHAIHTQYTYNTHTIHMQTHSAAHLFKRRNTEMRRSTDVHIHDTNFLTHIQGVKDTHILHTQYTQTHSATHLFKKRSAEMRREEARDSNPPLPQILASEPREIVGGQRSLCSRAKCGNSRVRAFCAHARAFLPAAS